MMIEMPEATTIARQMNETLTGKTIKRFKRGNKTHKFLWLNKSYQEYENILPGLRVAGASSFGRSIYLHLGENMIWWSDTGGKLLYHKSGEKPPKNYHLCWEFDDDSQLTFAMQMWGGVKLLEKSEFGEKPNEETGVEPLSDEFTLDRFNQMLDDYPEKTSKGVKGFLVATGYVSPNHVAGLGNGIIQDILFKAGLSPRRKIMDISSDERELLYKSINTTVADAIKLGGRYDEFDHLGNKGGYIRFMDSKTKDTPCINCGTLIKKISYLGGA
ncbi:DNA-formamidopyrimidine glycosylase family protein, partial [Chloroflexota bacterium]